MSELKKTYKSLYFQDEVHNQLIRTFSNQSPECGILKLPTGAGKTYVGSKFIVERYLKNRENILWVAHRWTHINHFLKTLSDLKLNDINLDFDVVLIGDKINIDHNSFSFEIEKVDSFIPKRATVYVSSVQTLINRRLPENLNLVVFDEDHWGVNGSMRETILSGAGLVSTLGLTATPVRSNYHRPVEMIGHEFSYLRLAGEGYLARAVNTSYNTKKTYVVDKEGLRKNQINRLIRNKSIEDSSRQETVINFYISNIDFFGKTFIFCPSAGYAQVLAQTLKDKFKYFRNDVFIDSIVSANYKPHEYNFQINKFKSHQGPGVLTSFGILSDGVDIPDLKTVFILHKTGSDIKFAQMFGRGTRTDDGKKMTFNLVDFQDNIEDSSVSKILSPNQDLYYSDDKCDFDAKVFGYDDSIIISKHSISEKLESSMWRDTFKEVLWDILKKTKFDSNRLISDIGGNVGEVMTTFLFAKLNPQIFPLEFRDLFNQNYFSMNWEDFEILASLFVSSENPVYKDIKGAIMDDILEVKDQKITRVNLSKIIDKTFSDEKLDLFGRFIFGLKSLKNENSLEFSELKKLCEMIISSCFSFIEYDSSYNSVKSILSKIGEPGSFESRYHVLKPAADCVLLKYGELQHNHVETIINKHLVINLRAEWKASSCIGGERPTDKLKIEFKKNLLQGLESHGFKTDLEILMFGLQRKAG